MIKRQIIWPTPIRRKLLAFRSYHFTPDETLDFITQFIMETQDILSNLVISRYYTEEHGDFKGISRIVIRKFKVYFEISGNDVVILAVKFPGESL